MATIEQFNEVIERAKTKADFSAVVWMKRTDAQVGVTSIQRKNLVFVFRQVMDFEDVAHAAIIANGHVMAIWHAQPATGTAQAAFGVGDYVVIKPDCTVGELSFIREKGRIGRIVDVSGILRAEFHVIRISPKYCELADFAALSSEPEAGSDATVSPALNNALNVLSGENRQWVQTSPEQRIAEIFSLLDDAGVRDGGLMSITDRVKALIQERDRYEDALVRIRTWHRSEKGYSQEMVLLADEVLNPTDEPVKE